MEPIPTAPTVRAMGSLFNPISNVMVNSYRGEFATVVAFFVL